MPSTRDLFLILRAQDQASRALGAFSRAVKTAGTDAMLAQLQARKGAEAAALGQNQLAQAGLRNEVAQLANENAMIRTNVAQAKLGGTTKAYLDAQKAAIIANEREIQIRRDMIIGHQDDAIAIKNTIQGLEGEIATRRNAISAIKDHETSSQHLSENLKAAAQTAVTVGVGLLAVGAVGVAAFFNMAKASAEYERQVAMTATQITGFNANMEELGQIGLDVGKNIAVPLQEIQPMLYDIFSSMDVNLAQSKILLTAFAKEAVAGQVSLQDAGRATISIMNAFHLPAEDVNKVLDVQFQLVRKGVGTFSEFSSTIGRSIPSAVRAGQSVETLAGMLAFLTRNGLSAAMASASAGRAFDAMSNPATVKRLEDMGIKVRNAKGEFLPLVDTLQQLRDKLMAMPGPERLKAITDIFKGSGGTIQARRFLDQVLLKPGDLEQFKSLLDDMQNAGGAFSDAYDRMSNTVSAKTQVMKNRFEELKIQIGNLISPVLGKLLDVGNAVLDWFLKLDPKTQKMIVYFGLAATAAALLGGGLFLVIGGLAAMGAAFAAVGLSMGGVLLVIGLIIIGVGLLVAAVALFVTSFKNAYDHSESFRKSIDKVKDSVAQFIDEIKYEWNKYVQPALDDTAKVIKEKLKPAWDDFYKTIVETIAPKIKEFIDWMKDNTKPVMKEIGRIIKEELNPALSDLADWWKQNKSWVQPLVKDLTEMGKQLAQLVVLITVISGLTGFATAVGGFKGLVGALGIFGEFVRWATQDWEHLMFTLLGLGIVQFALEKAIDGIKKAWDAFWKWIWGAANDMQKKWDELKDWWKDGHLQHAIEDALNAILGIFGVSMTGMKNKSGEGMGDIKIKFDLGFGDITKAVKNGFTDIGNAFGGGMNDIISRALGINLIKTIFNAAIQNVKQNFDDGLKGIATSFAGLPGMILKAFPNPSGLLWSVGQSIVDGLAGGINSKAQNAAGAAARMAVNAYDAAKIAIGAKSPSRAFMQLGKYAVDGFSLGLTNTMQKFIPNLQAQFSALPVLAGGAMTPQPAPVTRNATFNITVNQADRSARQLAQDLGQELAGML